MAASMFVGVIAYAVFGGADYGCGLWDLTAGTDDIAARARRRIDASIGPVWEANHVWLIFVLVVLWTGFPTVFRSVMTTLAVPWSLVGLGIVFRGGAFVFRKSSPSFAQARLHGVVFAVSSVVTPFFLGAIAGAIAGGRVPIDGDGDPWTSWTGPLSMVGGLLAVTVTAFLAATLLAHDASAAGDRELAGWFRYRAVLAGAAAGAMAISAAVTIETSAPELADGLHGRALPLVLTSAVAGSLALVDLFASRFSRARISAVVAVAAILAGWGVGQYPDVLVGSATIEESAAADVTLWGLVGVTVAALVVVVPALLWLFRLVEQTDT